MLPSDAFLAALVNSSSDAILTKDLNGIITSWNKGAESIFGYTADEVIGKPVTLLFPPDRYGEEPVILAKIKRGEQVKHYETVRRRKDGSLIDISLTVSPIRDSDGTIIGISKIARDITELRQAREQLERHAAELETKVRERTAALEASVAELEAFSYSLSHDLRAPIRIIQSYAEIILADYGAQVPAVEDHLNKVIKASVRMDRLIQDVLSFTRLSREEIKLGPVDTRTIIADIVAERLELQAPAATVVIPDNLPPVIGHEAALTQCFTNLLHNAVKFVPPGVHPRVEVLAITRGDVVRLGVRDNGIGISSEDQEQLFALFRRLPAAHAYEGTGIGLAIVQKAVERMQGKVEVESTPGRGSTFWVELPKAPGA